MFSNIVLWLGGIFPRTFARQLANPTGVMGRAVGAFLNQASLELKEAAIEALELRPEHRVLEVGFGGGRTLEVLRDRLPRGVVAGVELSDTMVHQARLRFRHEISTGQMDISSGRASRIPVDDAQFDRVLGINTIYFWEDPMDALREIARVLKPGGMLLLGVGDKSWMETQPWVWHGFRMYEQTQLERLVERAGFRNVRTRPVKGESGEFLLLRALRPGPDR